jgi:cytochrome d ubiquinol oxidase subunit II
MMALLAIFGLGLYPNLIVSDPAVHSLTIYQAASSQKTLGIMLIVAILGMPMVIAYTVSIYWIFRGKVELNELSY